MIVSLIVAMEAKKGIGLKGNVPWHISTDLKRFKALTMGHHLIMGRKTYQSIGRPLPGRTTIILTRDHSFTALGCLIAHSLAEALELAKRRNENEAFITGGSEIYAQALEVADRIYVSEVHAEVASDVWFPALDRSEWHLIESSFHPAGGKDQYAHTFNILERKRRSPPLPH